MNETVLPFLGGAAMSTLFALVNNYNMPWDKPWHIYASQATQIVLSAVLSGLVAIVLYIHFGGGLTCLKWMVIYSYLIFVSVWDIAYKRLSPRICLIIIPLCLMIGWVETHDPLIPVIELIIGAALLFLMKAKMGIGDYWIGVGLSAAVGGVTMWNMFLIASLITIPFGYWKSKEEFAGKEITAFPFLPYILLALFMYNMLPAVAASLGIVHYLVETFHPLWGLF